VLPEFSGVDLLRQLKQNEQTRQIPTVAVTALARSQDRQAFLAEGFDDYLSKPFSIDDLAALVQTYCHCSTHARH
jgi:CheY-like chemotaxis protein